MGASAGGSERYAIGSHGVCRALKLRAQGHLLGTWGIPTARRPGTQRARHLKLRALLDDRHRQMRGFGELGMLALMGRGVLATSFDGLVNKETTASHLELSPPGLAVSPFFSDFSVFFSCSFVPSYLAGCHENLSLAMV